MSHMEEPQRKRLRAEDSDLLTGGSSHATSSTPTSNVTTPSAAIPDVLQGTTWDTEFTFQDGNIIIVAGDVAFKVYRGLLAEHSSVFRSMLDIGQAIPNPAEMVDGCHVIPLYDSPNDIRGLFRLIYPLSSTLHFSTRKVDMASISAIIRIDHKYELKGLYDQAMSYLTTYYTSSFDEWHQGRNTFEWRPEPTQAIGAINLARLTNTPSILPLAFYICATLGPDIARGYLREDGTVEYLSHEDLYHCLRLKEKLVAENVRAAYFVLQYARSSCTHPNAAQGLSPCGDLLRQIAEQARLANAPHPLSSDRALDSWDANIDHYTASQASAQQAQVQFVHHPHQGAFAFALNNMNMNMNVQRPRVVCQGCRDRVRQRDVEVRRQVWQKLPEFLGLTIDNWSASA
ncbi:hypothetical protein C8Q80DRAFT_1238079 [Daedaleopsis nitida]|nr:hypothetical protein C8Q80DRAFT_1238079 [Daedaleopsis nitida]